EQLVEARARSRQAREAFARAIDCFGPTTAHPPATHPFELALTVLATHLCSATAQQWGLESWTAPEICRRLLRRRGPVTVRGEVVTIAHPCQPPASAQANTRVHVDVHLARRPR
ncbi:MAG: hypothetical protein KDK70_44090, partial [Myxococcales bacterium]|nr:hypothetical protein [Myxococcales bacterium]